MKWIAPPSLSHSTSGFLFTCERNKNTQPDIWGFICVISSFTGCVKSSKPCPALLPSKHTLHVYVHNQNENPGSS